MKPVKRFPYKIHKNLMKILKDLKQYRTATICPVTGGEYMVKNEPYKCSDVCGILFPRLPKRTISCSFTIHWHPSRDRWCPCNELSTRWLIKRLNDYFINFRMI